MEFTTDEEDFVTCRHCGRHLPMRMMEWPFKSRKDTGPLRIGYEQCGCEGAKAERKAHELAERERERKKIEAEYIADIEAAGIPKRYEKAVHERADEVAARVEQGGSWYIFGPQGTGKTTLAMAAARKLIWRGRKVMAISSYDMMDAMRSIGREDKTLIERAKTRAVLVIDDLGKEASNTPHACERLFAIIDTRDKAMLPTIVTSNYMLSELAQKITEGDAGKSIASRLYASCEQLPMTGRDRRLSDG